MKSIAILLEASVATEFILEKKCLGDGAKFVYINCYCPMCDEENPDFSLEYKPDMDIRPMWQAKCDACGRSLSSLNASTIDDLLPVRS